MLSGEGGVGGHGGEILVTSINQSVQRALWIVARTRKTPKWSLPDTDAMDDSGNVATGMESTQTTVRARSTSHKMRHVCIYRKLKNRESRNSS